MRTNGNARKDRAARREAGARQLHLREELREEVADLRACDEERVPCRRALGADDQSIRREGWRLEWSADEASVVDDDASGGRVARQLVRERPGRRDRGLRVVHLAQVGEDATGVGRAQATAERVQEHRVRDLLAAVGTESSGDERSRRDHVVGRELLNRDAVGRVVRVHARGVRVDDRQDVPADRPLGPERVDLVREERLGFGARGERLPRERKLERIEARHVERGDAGRPADELQQEPSVGCSHPAGAEGDVGLRLPRDVGDVEAVADDRDSGARTLALPRLVRSEAERRRLEVAADRGGGDISTQRGERVVPVRLVGRVAVERQAPVLARRQDRPGRCGVVALRRCRLERGEHEHERRYHGHDERGGRPMHARRVPAAQALQSTAVDALLAFAAVLVSLRLSARLAVRFRTQKRPEQAAWSAALAAYALAAGALAWGAAYGWTEPAFRAYYLGGGLLTAPLLGVGSLLLVGRRRVVPLAFAYVGLAVGVAVAVPLHGSLSGTDVPQAQDLLALWPARVLAIVANSLGTLAVVAVAVATIRRRPLGNVLVLAGIGVAALGSALAGLGVGALAPIVIVAVLLLYAGFTVPNSFHARTIYPRDSTHSPPTV